jgi:hypothetical protein
MNSTYARFVIVGSWIASICVLVGASTVSALGVAALWSIPAAVAVTVSMLIWPGHRLSRAFALFGLAWQASLIIAYWPFSAVTTAQVGRVLGPMPMPFHAIVISAVLGVLTLAFLIFFLVPAVGLLARLGRIHSGLRSGAAGEADVAKIVATDAALSRSWQEYLGYLRPSKGGQRISTAPARLFLNLATCAETRLRVEFFRNLPGIFTGIGIIGTFSGLILGLRAFRVSDETSVVQNSLNGLLQGVWESFLISAVAITLAIVATVSEKIIMAALARRFDAVARRLDEVFPLESVSPSSEHMTHGAAQAIEALVNRLPGMIASAVASSPASASDRSNLVSAGASSAKDSSSMGSSQVIDALRSLTERLDIYFNDHVKATALAQQQSNQTLKSLAGRLEMVASSIESSGRKTMEVVGTRLMDAQLNMSSRQQAMSEQMADLVGRIEVLCGLMQRDPGNSHSTDYAFGVAARVDDTSASMNGSGVMRVRNPHNAAPASNWFGAGRAGAAPEPVAAGSVDFGSPMQFVQDFSTEVRPGGSRFGS